MNILWITNIVLPEAQLLLHKSGVLKSSGGWLIGAAETLSSNNGVKLTVATVSKDVSSLTCLEGERITYYLLPYGKGNIRKNKDYIAYWRTINNAIHPDVVHIHGTEYSHGLAFIDACGSENVCVSIQGLVSAYQYYYYGLTKNEIVKSQTLAGLLFGGILKGYNEFRERSNNEIEIIQRVHHVIGRTSWDKSRIWAINPAASYHFGGETLRDVFYSKPQWQYDNCRPHSIFVSQAGYPIKGFHMLLRAMPLVKRHFPDANIRVAGNDITRCDTLKSRLLLGNYGNLIRRIIRDNDLVRNVSFTGPLDSEGMVRELLSANVFVCPSTVENSPNSLGEAQVLGVPAITSYVGGIPDMMRGDENHLYRFEEIEMLAYKLVQLFQAGKDIDTEKMRRVALARHNPIESLQQLLQTYQEIMNECHDVS